MSRINALFGRVVKRLRTNLNLTQKELSAKADIDQTYISTIEKGKASMTFILAERLSKGLGVDMFYMFREMDKLDKGRSYGK